MTEPNPEFELNWDSIDSVEEEPPEWTIENLLPVGLVIIAGPPKQSRKTTIQVGFALRVSTNENLPFMSDYKVHFQGPSMFITPEHSSGELKSIALTAFKTNPENIYNAKYPGTFNFSTYETLSDGETQISGVQKLVNWLEYKKPQIAFIDPLVDFHNEDENNAVAMNKILRPFQLQAKRNKTTVIITHHTSKKNSQDVSNFSPENIRGSSAMRGLADGIITITPKSQTEIILNAEYKRGAAIKDLRVNVDFYK